MRLRGYLLYRGIVGNRSRGWQRSKVPATPKPSRAHILHEEAETKAQALANQRKTAEREVEKLSKPVKNFAIAKEKARQRMLQAKKAGKSFEEFYEAGRVSDSEYEQFLKARARYDSAKDRAAKLVVEEINAKDRADRIKPSNPKPVSAGRQIIKFLFGF